MCVPPDFSRSPPTARPRPGNPRNCKQLGQISESGRVDRSVWRNTRCERPRYIMMGFTSSSVCCMSCCACLEKASVAAGPSTTACSVCTQRVTHHASSVGEAEQLAVGVQCQSECGLPGLWPVLANSSALGWHSSSSSTSRAASCQRLICSSASVARRSARASCCRSSCSCHCWSELSAISGSGAAGARSVSRQPHAGCRLGWHGSRPAAGVYVLKRRKHVRPWGGDTCTHESPSRRPRGIQRVANPTRPRS